MTGSAPQPGETRRAEGNPWAFADPEAQWWKGDTAAHPVITPTSGPLPAAPAEQAGAEQAGAELAGTEQAGAEQAGAQLAGTEAVVTAAEPEPAASATQLPAPPRTARRTRKAKPPKSVEPSAEVAADTRPPAPVTASAAATGPATAHRATGDGRTADTATAAAPTAAPGSSANGGNGNGGNQDSGDRDDVDRYDEPTDDVMAGSAAATAAEHSTGDPIAGDAVSPGDDARADGAPATPDPARPDLAKPDAATPDPAEPDAATPDPAEPDPAEPDPATPDPATPDPAEPDPATPDPATPDAAGGGTAGRRGDGYDGDTAPAVPDVMVLPEPGRDRPTVVVARGPVPGQQRPDQPAPQRSSTDRAVPTRVAQPQSAMATKLETSPFWLDPGVGERHPADTTPQALPAAPSRLGVPPRRLPPAPRKPASGLLTLLVFALVAAFFAWVSAEPLWLAVGHGDRGAATVTRCTGEGVTQRCTGVFTADGGAFTVPGVALLGVDGAERAEGAVVPARMTSRDSRQAFVGGGDLTVHLRWAIGVLLVLLCGLGIAATTGAGRLESARARRRAVLISLAGPLALLVGFLAVSY